MNYNIYGTFTKSKGFIYRTKTYIQFGQSEEIIGSCVLCNPGSARLDDKSEQNRLLEYTGKEDLVIDGKVYEDPVMKQLIKILGEVDGLEEEGRFLIYNIFTLRNGNMDNAIKEFEHPDMNENLLYRDYEDYTNFKSNLPWILIGWGCKDNRELNKIKRKWLNNFSEGNLINIGKKHAKKPHCYHVGPKLESKKIEYREYIVPRIEEIIRNDFNN